MSKMYGNAMKKLQMGMDAANTETDGESCMGSEFASPETKKSAKGSTPKIDKAPKKGAKQTKTTKTTGKRKTPVAKKPETSSEENSDDERIVEQVEKFPRTAKRMKVKNESSEPESVGVGLNAFQSDGEEEEPSHKFQSYHRMFKPLVKGADPYESSDDDVEMA